MKILISGVCGFVGSNLAQGLRGNVAGREIIGLDNLSRAGSQLNIEPLRQHGVTVRHADLRCPSDLEGFSSVDWIIDAAANPSVLAGAGQFGHAEQGIFSFWINAYLRRQPLKYIGFDGAGHQCHDCRNCQARKQRITSSEVRTRP